MGLLLVGFVSQRSRGPKTERRVRWQGGRSRQCRRASAVQSDADREFVWGRAEIHADTVRNCSPHVPDPLSIRYAWTDNPTCNLVNGANLPAEKFRTDDWPGATKDQR